MAKTPILFFCIFVAIAALCGLCFLVLSDTRSAPEIAATDAVNGPDESAADEGRLDLRSNNAEPLDVKSSRERSKTKHREAGPKLFESTSSARELLTESVRSYGWSEEALEANLHSWTRLCSELRRFQSYGHSPADKLAGMEPAVEHGVQLSRYCEGLINVETGQPNEDLVRELREASSGPGNSMDYEWRIGAELRAAGDLELIEDLAVHRLDQALRNMNEAGVRGAVLELLRPQASELISLPPELAGRKQGYASLYLPVAYAVAAALVCQEVGGCYGSGHPMVLRTCMEAAEHRIGCVNPTDVIQALYQTQTPVEHRLFWSLFDQVNAILAAYRRK